MKNGSFAVVKVLYLLTALSQPFTAFGEDAERGLVSYVLENFDVEDPQNEAARNVLLDSVDIWEESTGSGLDVFITKEAYHGSSSVGFNYTNSEGGVYIFQSILNVSAVHAAAAGASHAFLTYRHRLQEDESPEGNNLSCRLVLFDSADCVENCSKEENLESWEYYVGSLVADNTWKTIGVPLLSDGWIHASGAGNGVLDFHKLKGWRLEISSTKGSQGGTILLDQLALDGDGRMVSPAFQTTSWEEAIQDELVAPMYYQSDISENNAEQLFDEGHFYVNYTLEQTELWGGFIQYDFSVPGRAFFNISRAEAIGFDYSIIEPSSIPGRVHIRLIMLDRSDCWVGCGPASPNVENYYSFHFILDETIDEGSVAVELKGDSISGSPFWRTGWYGTIGNDVLDKATIKGYKIEISMDSQGDLGSLVSGIFDLSNMEVKQTFEPLVLDTSMCVVETNLRFLTSGKTKYQRIEFLNFEECCNACTKDPVCAFAFSDGRDCFKTDYIHHEDLGYSTDVDSVLHSFIKQSNEDFCEVCDCRESDATIDCRGRDLVRVPQTFLPDKDGFQTWKTLDLRENPRLVILPSRSLDSLPNLEVVVCLSTLNTFHLLRLKAYKT